MTHSIPVEYYTLILCSSTIYKFTWYAFWGTETRNKFTIFLLHSDFRYRHPFKKFLRSCKQLLDFLWAIHCLAINTGCVPIHYYTPTLTSIYTLEKWHDWLFRVRQQQKNLGNKKFVIKSLEKCSFHFVKLNGHFNPRIQFDRMIDCQLVHLFYY